MNPKLGFANFEALLLKSNFIIFLTTGSVKLGTPVGYGFLIIY